MGKRKGPSKYQIKWSMNCCPGGPDVGSECNGTIIVDAGKVDGMSEDERTAYFQEQVDNEVNRNGPCGCVDSVDEVE